MASHDKTEKATPKKREDARKKGQVARSVDLTGAVILMAALLVLPAVAPLMLEQITLATHRALALITTPEVIGEEGIWEVLGRIAVPAGLATLPLAMTCAVAGVLVNVAQVGWKPAPQGVKPDFKRMNPIQGAKNIFGPRAAFETGKNVVKVAAVGAIAAVAVFPKLDELADLVGLPPAALLPLMADTCLGIAQRAAAAYLVIAVADLLYQRWHHEKQLRMDKKEVRDELKQQGLPAEVRSALRRKQMQAAQGRMMDAVPTADVVVTNPTHYAVALRYDGTKAAPEVVAKGMDHLALRIRALAAEHDVPVIPDPPLARSLHAAADVGHIIPEELYAAVAEVLAFVYRTAARRGRAVPVAGARA